MQLEFKILNETREVINGNINLSANKTKLTSDFEKKNQIKYII